MESTMKYDGLSTAELNALLRESRKISEGFYLCLWLMATTGISWNTARKVRVEHVKRNGKISSKHLPHGGLFYDKQWYRMFLSYQPSVGRKGFIHEEKGNPISKRKAEDLIKRCYEGANIKSKNRSLNIGLLRVTWISNSFAGNMTLAKVMKRIPDDYEDVILHHARKASDKISGSPLEESDTVIFS